MGNYLRNPREFDELLKANAVLGLMLTTRWGDRTLDGHCVEMSLLARRPRLPRKGQGQPID